MKLAIAVVVSLVLAACGGPATCPIPPRPKFEMKGYTLVLLKRGPAWSAEQTPEAVKLGEGHMANIKAMGKSGKLVLAGPTDVDAADREAVAGIFLFDVTERAEVEALLANDPAIAAHRFVPVILPWYGPAGITYAGREEPLPPAGPPPASSPVPQPSGRGSAASP